MPNLCMALLRPAVRVILAQLCLCVPRDECLCPHLTLASVVDCECLCTDAATLHTCVAWQRTPMPGLPDEQLCQHAAIATSAARGSRVFEKSFKLPLVSEVILSYCQHCMYV